MGAEDDVADEDRDQDRAEERESAARPVTAAARRERRASARGDSAPKGRVERVEDRAPARPAADKPRKGRPVEDATGKTTISKKDQGIATVRRGAGEKRPSVVARFARFVREVAGELRKVIWPTRRQQLTYTIVVLVFLTVVVAIVSSLDLLFAKGIFTIFA